MTKNTPAEKKPAPGPSPKDKSCQKTVRPPERGAGPAQVKKRRSWPIFEAALILVLLKITVGAFYIWNSRSAETGRGVFSALYTPPVKLYPLPSVP